MSLHGDEHNVFADDGDDADATAAAAAAAAQANNGSAPSATTPASSSSAAAGGSGGLSAATNALPLATTMAQGELRASSSATPPSMHHINISSYIPFKLDLAAGNYSKWRQFMFFVLSKFDVQDHVEVYSDPLQQSATWRHDDITIVLWFYATLSDELYDVVMTPASTAYQVWDALHTFFRDNQPGRAIHLSAEFRGLVQGDLSIQAYCRRLKSLSDALADVDEPVTNRTLTLQLLRGLNRRFQVIATVMSMQIPFPTFVQARSRLLLEETALNERDRTDRSTALYIGNSTTERGNSSTDRSNQNGGGNNDRGKAPANDRGNGGDRGRGNRGRGNRGRGRGNANGNGNGGRGQQQQQPATTPWMGYFAPWGAPMPAQWRAPWIPPNAAGVLGPRPANPSQAYPMMYQPAPATPSAASSSNWDQQSMLNAAMSNLQIQPNSNADWYLDSGATSHITGNAGSQQQDPDHEVQ